MVDSFYFQEKSQVLVLFFVESCAKKEKKKREREKRERMMMEWGLLNWNILPFITLVVGLYGTISYLKMIAKPNYHRFIGSFRHRFFHPNVLLVAFSIASLANLSSFLPKEWNLLLRSLFLLGHTTISIGLTFFCLTNDPEQGGPAAGIVLIYGAPFGGLLASGIAQLIWPPPQAEWFAEVAVLVWVFLSVKWGAACASD